jgi:drug/metabolite transporter (DMT)-like permease
MPSYPDDTATPAPLTDPRSRPGQMSSTRRSESVWAVWGALALVYVIWGSTYLGIRVVAEHLPAFGSAAVRFGVAAALLAAVLVVVRGFGALRISPRQLAACAVVGTFLLVGGNGLVVLAESPRFGVPSGVAALLVALGPILMVIFRAASGDRPRAATVAGVVIGFGGLAALFLPGAEESDHPVPVVGGVLVLVAVLCWTVGSFATRWLPMPADPFVASVFEMATGAALMELIAVARREPPVWTATAAPTEAWLALAYLIVFGSLVAFTAFVWLLHHAPLSLTMTYAYVNPVIALLLGAVLVGEVLTGQLVLAAAVVVLGVVLVVSTERPTRTG